MEANEFVKKFGWDAAKDILKNKRSWIDKKSGRKLTDNSFVLKSKTYEYAIGTLYMGNFSDYDENSYRVDEVNLLLLKRLVESHELVAIHGFEKSKEIVANAPSDDHFYSWTLGDSGVRDKTVNIGELRKAIADVESCMELANDSC